jgi:hypothetical protein
VRATTIRVELPHLSAPQPYGNRPSHPFAQSAYYRQFPGIALGAISNRSLA